jgi:hypothetical protein
MVASLKDPDPANRQRRYQDAAKELQELELITPEQAALPFDEKIAEQLLEQVDRGAWEKTLNERAAEGEKRVAAKAAERKQKREFASFYTGTVTDQESLNRFRSMLSEEDQQALPKVFDAKTTPAQIQSMFLTSAERATEARAARPTGSLREFYETFLPGWAAEQGKSARDITSKDVMHAITAWKKIQPGPQLQVGMTPEAEEQRVRVAGATAQAQAAAGAGKNTAVLRSKTLALKNLDDAVNSYKKELETTGPTVMPQKGARLKAQFTNLQMLTKSLFELGVITGPDMQILQGAITDPTGIRGNVMGTKALLEQLGVMKSIIERSKNNLAEVYGTGGTTPGGPPDDATHEYNPATGKIEAIRR